MTDVASAASAVTPELHAIPSPASLSAYAQGALPQIRMGYSTIRIREGEKRPYGNEWQKYCRSPATLDEVAEWSKGRFGIGIACGTIVNGLQVVAVDVDLEGDELEQALASLPASPMAKFGSKGLTRFYLCDPERRGRAYTRPRTDGRRGNETLVDFKANGGQVVVPPTIHPDTGRSYVWVRGPVPAHELPVLTADDLERFEDTLRHLGWDGKVAEPKAVAIDVRGGVEDESVWEEVNRLAFANIPAWAPLLNLYGGKWAGDRFEAVPTWREGGSGNPPDRRKRNLKIHSTGIRDFGSGEGFSPIGLVRQALDLPDLDAAYKWLADLLGITASYDAMFDHDAIEKSGKARAATKAASKAREKERCAVERDDGVLVDADTGEILGGGANDNQLAQDEVPERLLYPPGLVGQVADYIFNTARSPSRVLAIAAAIVVVGTLAGRRDGGPTESGTAMYVLGIAKSGIGKQHPLDQIQRLLTAAGAKDCIGASEFMSATALVKQVVDQPLVTCPMDEFGSFMKRINHKKAGVHDQMISKLLRQMWTMPFEPYNPPRWAVGASGTIHGPALSIFGVSTPKEFYDALTGGDVENGTLARFLVLPTSALPDDQTPSLNKRIVPETLADSLRNLYSARGRGFPLQEGTGEVAPEEVPWGDGAEVIYKDFKAELVALRRAKPELDELLGRTAEMAVRLATIVAVGRDLDNPIVTVDDITWGRDLADFSSKRLMADVKLYVSDNETGAKWSKITSVLVRHGGNAPYAVVMKSVKFGGREMDDVMKSMRDAELIDIVKVDRADGKPGRGGRHIVLLNQDD